MIKIGPKLWINPDEISSVESYKEELMVTMSNREVYVIKDQEFIKNFMKENSL